MGSARSKTALYYQQSGEVHVSELGIIGNRLQEWPTYEDAIDIDDYGRLFCDRNGIPRDYDWFLIGDFSRACPELYADFETYHLKIHK